MRAISEFQQLKWVQPSALKMHYDLESDEELVAQLRFRSLCGTHATAESAEGCWTFKRAGCLQTRTTICDRGSHVEIATFRNNTWKGGGSLKLSDGRRLLAATNFWQTQLEIQEESGESLIRLKSSGILRASASVEMELRALTRLELPWIPMFSWYLVVMMHVDGN